MGRINTDRQFKHYSSLVQAICAAAQIDPQTLYKNAKLLKNNLPSLKTELTIKW